MKRISLAIVFTITLTLVPTKDKAQIGDIIGVIKGVAKAITQLRNLAYYVNKVASMRTWYNNFSGKMNVVIDNVNRMKQLSRQMNLSGAEVSQYNAMFDDILYQTQQLLGTFVDNLTVLDKQVSAGNALTGEEADPEAKIMAIIDKLEKFQSDSMDKVTRLQRYSITVLNAVVYRAGSHEFEKSMQQAMDKLKKN